MWQILEKREAEKFDKSKVDEKTCTYLKTGNDGDDYFCRTCTLVKKDSRNKISKALGTKC